MKKFSQRYGHTPVREALQVDSIDDVLLNYLWNVVCKYYLDTFDNITPADSPVDPGDLDNGSNVKLNNLCLNIWVDFYHRTTDEYVTDWRTLRQYIKKRFYGYEWYEVYDFIEFLPQNYKSAPINKKFRNESNSILEKEMSAYRFVDNFIAPIVDKVEIESIEEAMIASSDQVREHLNTALEKLSDRRKPDYRNSIKESISAVESLVIQISGEKAKLSTLLKKLETRFGLHKSLRSAFDKLYGYTSDEDGIRHALLDEDTIDFEDAKFMLVTCSAFVNYVRGKLKED